MGTCEGEDGKVGMQNFDNALGRIFSLGYMLAPVFAAVLYGAIFLLTLTLIGSGIATLLKLI